MLHELECRVERWRAALDGAGPYPDDDYRWPEGLGRCPDHLAERARRVNAEQRDLQARLAVRRDALSALLHRETRPGRAVPVPLFVDQRT